MHILEKIVESKKKEVAINKSIISENKLTESPLFERETISLSTHLIEKSPSSIIAEFKRRSPSVEDIFLEGDVKNIAQAYYDLGAAAISILTDKDYFAGSIQDLYQVRQLEIPFLRKDFIIDTYQIFESKSIGADAILLIAEILTKEQIKEFSTIATDLGLEVILEIHEQNHLKKYNDNISIIGVNNRDLKNFTSNINNSIQLAPHLPSHTIKVSESGLNNVSEIKALIDVGYQSFLIGEHFMSTKNPGLALSLLLNELHALS